MTGKRILRVAGKAANVLITAALALLLIAQLYRLAANKLFRVAQPTVFGYGTAVVLTGSMDGGRPDSIRADDLIVTRRADGYAVGDVILFESGSSTVTHRIVGATDEGYRTQGDANDAADPDPVPPDAVVGKVVHVWRGGGRFVRLLRSPLTLLLGLIVLIAVIEIPQLCRKRSARH